MKRSHACSGSPTPRDPPATRDSATDGIAFHVHERVGIPNKNHFEAQPPGPRAPLSTLRCALTERQRMTRGHRDSLDLRCRTLSFPSSCRLSGAFHARVLRPRGTRRRLAKTPPPVSPSADPQHVGTPIVPISSLPSPASAHPHTNASLRPHGTPTHGRGHRDPLDLRRRTLPFPSF